MTFFQSMVPSPSATEVGSLPIGAALADVLDVQRDHAILVLVEQRHGILLRDHHPADVHLDLHVLRIGHGEQVIERGLAVELFELGAVVVITESHAGVGHLLAELVEEIRVPFPVA